VVKFVTDFEENVGHHLVTGALEIEDVSGGRTDGFDGKIAASQNGGNGERAGIAGIAETVLKTSDGHVRHFANGIVDDFIPPLVDFLLGHSEELLRAQSGKRHSEVEVDQTVDITDKPHGPHNTGCRVSVVPQVVSGNHLA
jgi:hypothetical protein